MAVDWSDSRIFRLRIEFSSKIRFSQYVGGWSQIRWGRVLIERLDSLSYMLLRSFRLICKTQNETRDFEYKWNHIYIFMYRYYDI